MPKTTRRRARRASTDRSATTDIVTQLECAVRRPQATLIGALVGGIVPWFARTLAHGQLPQTWAAGSRGLAAVMLAVILGCAAFSAITVYKFGRATFNDTRKALGFVLAIEGVMLVSTGATSNVALAVLVLINALANGSAIALARDATCKQREAAARASATRRSRAAARAAQDGARVPSQQAAPAPAPRAPSAPRPRAQRTSVAVVKVPRWSAAQAADTVVDAEIVSEESFLS